MEDIKFGTKWNSLTFLQRLDRDTSRALFLCDCGNGCEKKIAEVKRGHGGKCGDYCPLLNKIDWNSICENGTGVRYVWHKYKSNANSCKREFTISPHEFAEIVQSRCSYCGAKPGNVKVAKTGKSLTSNDKSEITYNGIDRVDTSKGYIPGNCVSCCFRCNCSKNDMLLEDFKLWIANIYKYTILQEKDNK